MRCVMLSLLLLLSFTSAFASVDNPQIVVYGEAKTSVAPDELQWSLLVKTEGVNVGEVTKAHMSEVSEVLSTLQAFGLGEAEVATGNMQLMENWAYRNNSRVKDGYFASTGFSFKTTDFERYAEFWTRLTELKNVAINGVNFTLSNREEIENSTKIKAIKAGREKALRFAEALGSTIKEPLLIEEIGDGTPGPVPVYRTMAAANNAGGGQVISPGREDVSVQVKLVFELEHK